MKYTLLIIALILSSLAAAEENHDHDHFAMNGLLIHNPRIKTTPPGIQNTAIYFQLMNHSDKAITLVGVASNAAKLVEIHEHSMQDGLMKMIKTESVTIPENSLIKFEPGSYHVMMIGVHKVIREGDKIELSLTLATGETKKIIATATPNQNTHRHQH